MTLPPAADLQAELDAAVDTILDLLEASAAQGVEIDPLATIMQRLQARGGELDLSEMPPLLQMLFAGMSE